MGKYVKVDNNAGQTHRVLSVITCGIKPDGYLECPEKVGASWFYNPVNGEFLSPDDFTPEIVTTPRQVFSNTLANMVHDFGDGRVIQVRPPETGKADESNIRNAIERMGRTGVPVESWYMADNTFHDITAAELQTALESGQDQTATAWTALREALTNG